MEGSSDSDEDLVGRLLRDRVPDDDPVLERFVRAFPGAFGSSALLTLLTPVLITPAPYFHTPLSVPLRPLVIPAPYSVSGAPLSPGRRSHSAAGLSTRGGHIQLKVCPDAAVMFEKGFIPELTQNCQKMGNFKN